MTNDEKIKKIIDIVKIDDRMQVTYAVYGKYNKLLYDKHDTACFSGIPRNDSWFKMKYKLQCSEKNKEFIKFWIELMMRIEPKITIENDYLVIPNLGWSKTMIMLTAIRYLGEANYDCIPKLTKNILDLKPDIDPLKAVLLANSCTVRTGGWGHSLVHCVVGDLKGVWDYRRYKGCGVQEFTNSVYGNGGLLMRIREAKTHDYDVLPVLKQYGYE